MVSEKIYFPENCYRQRCENTFVDSLLIHSSSNIPQNPTNPFNISDIINLYIKHGVSAHYIIDRSGKTYPLLSEKTCAFHAGKGSVPWFPERTDKLNDFSIGIELLAIGTWEEMQIHNISKETYESLPKSFIGYTAEQYKALNNLIEDICSRFPEIKKTRKHIFGHDEYAQGRKTDPGILFDWSQVNLLG